VAHDDWTHFVVFGPCKIFCFLNRSLQKNLFLKIVPGETILKNKIFCRDQKQSFFFLQGPKLKRGIFAETSTIFKPIFYDRKTLFLYIKSNLVKFNINSQRLDIAKCFQWKMKMKIREINIFFGQFT